MHIIRATQPKLKIKFLSKNFENRSSYFDETLLMFQEHENFIKIIRVVFEIL